MARKRNPRAGCPHPQCSNGDIEFQSSLERREELCEELEEAGVAEPDRLYRCSYCGCVYKPTGLGGATRGDVGLILGFWEADGWQPLSEEGRRRLRSLM